jgi:ribosomal protein S12 methylthiotransferase accessory factor
LPGPCVQSGAEGYTGSIALLILDRFDFRQLTEFDRRCADSGTPRSFFYFDVSRGWFGPHVTPGRSPDFRDLYARRLAAAPDPGVLRAREEETPLRDGYVPPSAEISWMLSAFLIDVERWLAGLPAKGFWHEVELDPIEMAIVSRPFLPLPGSVPCAAPPWVKAEPADVLVGGRLGIVTALRTVRHDRPLPANLTTVQAVGCDMRHAGPWWNDPVGGGSAFDNASAARRAAIGEVVERYCGNIVRRELVTRATYDELVARGEHAVDPDTLVLYSAAQYSAPGFPFVPLARDQVTDWVRGHSLTRDVPAWLPASLVYVNWYGTELATGSATNGAFYAGIAAGPDLRSSIRAGLLEVIERHATMVWWLNRPVLKAVRPAGALSDTWPEATSGGQLRGWLIAIENEFSVPVIAGVVEDRAQRLLTIGFAARGDPEQACLKAWTEGLILQEISRDLLSPKSVYNSVVASHRLADQGLKAWRPDRQYLDAYRHDFHDVTSLLCQPQVYLDPRAVDMIRPWVDVPAGISLDELPRLEPDTLETLQAAVESRGHEIYYADITTSDVAATGLRVTRTLVPGTIPNSPAAFHYLGRNVAQDSAVRLGWRSQPLAESELTTIPLPHA